MAILFKRRSAILAFFALTLSIACGTVAPATPSSAVPASQTSPSAAAAAFPATVTDFQGRSVTLRAKPQRIVSIGSSNTEFLFALGAGDRVVGVDAFSDEPAAAKAIAKVGDVKVNVEAVVALRPDLVLTTKFSDGTLERLSGASLVVLVVDPQSLADVAKTAVLIGTAVGADGGALATKIQRDVDAVKQKAASATTRPRVFHELDASDPAKLYTVGPGSFIAEIIDIAGGTNIAAKAGSAYPQLSLEEIVRSDPEVIVLGDADFGMTPEMVASRPGFSGISAVKNKKILAINTSLVSRPGPRVAQAAEAYAKLLHAELFR